MSDQETPKLRIKEPEAAEYTGMSRPWLRLARMGRVSGPPFLRIGRAIVYDIRDLDVWLAAHRVERA